MQMYSLIFLLFFFNNALVSYLFQGNSWDESLLQLMLKEIII